jgi:hypothetical protein
MPEPPAESLAWVRGAAKVKKLALPVSLIVGITAISGAFVAGNDAGRAFNTFPKMGDTWIPDNIFEMKPLLRNFFENTATVQLDHRLLATTTLIAIGTMWWFTRKLDIHPAVKALIGSTVGMTAVQVKSIIINFNGNLKSKPLIRFPFLYFAGDIRCINASELCSGFTRKCTPSRSFNTSHFDATSQSHSSEAITFSSQISSTSC